VIYERIMVAIDGSKTSHSALLEAVRLAKDQKAKLQVIYVVDESIVNYIEGYVDFDALWDAYKEEGRDILARISVEVKSSNVSFATRMVELKPFEGRLAEKIVAEAQAWPADLLVVGTHGRRGVSHFFLGSVAESVTRIATMPVLLIRSQ
jgi:nucleotide-binding universal stress UspA family protein